MKVIILYIRQYGSIKTHKLNLTRRVPSLSPDVPEQSGMGSRLTDSLLSFESEHKEQYITTLPFLINDRSRLQNSVCDTLGKHIYSLMKKQLCKK